MARPKKPTQKRHVTIDYKAEITDEDVRDAIAVLQRDYYQDVEVIGDELIGRIKDGEIPDRDGFQDALHEDVDGARRVIITWEARKGLLSTANEDAYFEELGEQLVCDGSVPYEQLMFYAMQRDVVEYMTREGFDPDDESLYEAADEEDEED